ncbi:bifunctional metallophosphatase/5'-nucleotidase [Alginatibacterium sediminis]|uniref:Bifunctional metallophosphatase/5'-nucleotidase n=1 Tax=Alginatibacterium sediminis TaxID=2164068 RepID=A0A420E6M9_9ALTE|nr:5'-nucleotidase C-terminal domain-containing protein [Alginatibacterium sediminis]RKF14277.1 bifunctional metallophosphatase/5'-nucleotidase [Alginatibacterium sediminis]
MPNKALGFTQIACNPKGAFDALYIPKQGGDIPVELRVPGPSNFDLNIYHINDLHQNLVSHSGGERTDNMALIAAYVAQVREQQSGHQINLFMSAGDEHIGSVFDELLDPEPGHVAISASYHCLSAAGLDASVLGNHELDKETEAAQRSIKNDAQFVVLSANLKGSRFKAQQQQVAIALANGLRIGLLGLSPATDIYLHTQSDPSLTIADAKNCVNQHIKYLDPFVDCWIILSHLGYCAPGQYQRHPSEFGDLELMEQLHHLSDKPSLIVGGHSHSCLNQNQLEAINQRGNCMVVQAGAFAKYLGHARIVKTADSAYTKSACLTSITQLKGMPSLSAAAQRFRKTYLSPLEQRLEHKLALAIAQAPTDSALSIASIAKTRYSSECSLANFMNDAIVAQSQHFAQGPVDIAIFNASAISGFTLHQDLRYADIYSMMPYADQIIVISISGKQLQHLLQSNAQRLFHPNEFIDYGGRYDPNQLLERGFLHFSAQLRYRLKSTKQSQSHTFVDAQFKGEPLDQTRTYKVAITSFLAYGKGFWSGESVIDELAINPFNLAAIAREHGIETGLLYRSELIDFIKGLANKRIDHESGAKLDGRVSFL